MSCIQKLLIICRIMHMTLAYTNGISTNTHYQLIFKQNETLQIGSFSNTSPLACYTLLFTGQGSFPIKSLHGVQ